MELSFTERRKLSFSMICLYFVLWGVQFIGFNYLPIYLTELKFDTNTVGLVVAFGYIVSMVVQPI